MGDPVPLMFLMAVIVVAALVYDNRHHKDIWRDDEDEKRDR